MPSSAGQWEKATHSAAPISPSAQCPRSISPSATSTGTGTSTSTSTSISISTSKARMLKDCRWPNRSPIDSTGPVPPPHLPARLFTILMQEQCRYEIQHGNSIAKVSTCTHTILPVRSQNKALAFHLQVSVQAEHGKRYGWRESHLGPVPESLHCFCPDERREHEVSPQSGPCRWGAARVSSRPVYRHRGSALASL